MSLLCTLKFNEYKYLKSYTFGSFFASEGNSAMLPQISIYFFKSEVSPLRRLSDVRAYTHSILPDKNPSFKIMNFTSCKQDKSNSNQIKKKRKAFFLCISIYLILALTTCLQRKILEQFKTKLTLTKWPQQETDVHRTFKSESTWSDSEWIFFKSWTRGA